MKRLVLLLAMTIICITASSQTVDVNKVKEAVEKNRPKHSQLQEGSSNTQAAVAAQQAAIATQANAAVANAQQQAQYIDQTYTSEGLEEQYSRKPTVPAGPHTASSYSQKYGGVSFGKGAGKANKTIPIRNAGTKNNVSKQGQSGTIGGNGNSYIPTYKNAKQFKSTIRPKVQQRKPRIPTGTSNVGRPKTMISKITNRPIYPRIPSNKNPIDQQRNRPTNPNRNRPTNPNRNRPVNNPSNRPVDNPYPNNHPTLPPRPGKPIERQATGLGKVPNRNIEIVPKTSNLKKGMTGGTIAMNLAVSRRNTENIVNGLTDGWRSKNTAFQKPLYAKPIGGGKCVILDNGRCVKR